MTPLAVLGVTTATDVPALPAGRDDLRVVVEGELAAIVRELGVAELEALRRERTDLDAVASLARDHDRVLAELVVGAGVLPFRLGTVLDGEAAVSTLLRDRGAALLDAVRRLAGAVEWVATVSGPVGASPAAVQDDSPPRSGRDYLLGRQRARDRASEARRAVARAVDEVAQALGGASVETIDLAPGSSAQGGEALARFALLVPRGRQDALRQVADAVASDLPGGWELELSGPWPAYHFSDVTIT